MSKNLGKITETEFETISKLLNEKDGQERISWKILARHIGISEYEPLDRALPCKYFILDHAGKNELILTESSGKKIKISPGGIFLQENENLEVPYNNPEIINYLIDLGYEFLRE